MVESTTWWNWMAPIQENKTHLFQSLSRRISVQHPPAGSFSFCCADTPSWVCVCAVFRRRQFETEIRSPANWRIESNFHFSNPIRNKNRWTKEYEIFETKQKFCRKRAKIAIFILINGFWTDKYFASIFSPSFFSVSLFKWFFVVLSTRTHPSVDVFSLVSHIIHLAFLLYSSAAVKFKLWYCYVSISPFCRSSAAFKKRSRFLLSPFVRVFLFYSLFLFIKWKR